MSPDKKIVNFSYWLFDVVVGGFEGIFGVCVNVVDGVVEVIFWCIRVGDTIASVSMEAVGTDCVLVEGFIVRNMNCVVYCYIEDQRLVEGWAGKCSKIDRRSEARWIMGLCFSEIDRRSGAFWIMLLFVYNLLVID